MKANEAQNDAAWMAARAGSFTASRCSDLMATTKTGPAASRKALLWQLAVERVTGACVETYSNAAMQRGVDLEAEGRDAYSFECGAAVTECGYIAHPTIPNCGASPDGLLGDDGLLEIKCPSSMAKHGEALVSGSHAVEYRWQLQHQLMVTGRAWVDAVSYDPRFPEGLQLAIRRVHRDEAAISAIRSAIAEAESEVSDLIVSINNLKAIR